MNRTTNSPLITLRIPGDWSHPRELVERLPAGFCLTPQALAVPNGAKIDFIPLAPDDQFASIFRSSCRRPPTDEELAIVARYTVNVGLTGPGGSLESALTMMQAGAAIVRAGGAGVFIDNSALAHGGNDWLEMTDDGGPDAISFAFASIVRGRDEVYTMGMQVMGFPNLLLVRATSMTARRRSSKSFATSAAAADRSKSAICSPTTRDDRDFRSLPKQRTTSGRRARCTILAVSSRS